MSSIWKAQQISKRYRSHTALFPLTIEFQAGQCTALCGGNGAGKSTLLQIMAGITRSSSGTIIKPMNIRIGYMPDRLIFPPRITAREILDYFARLKGCGGRERDEALEEVGLTNDADRYAAHFSKGMQQRLLFAQAILGNPDVLLLDEPSNGLDPLWIALWKQILKEKQRQGKTVIFSSHVLHDVVDLAERIVLFDQGRLIDDSPAEAWKKPGQSLEELFFEKLQLHV